jgi:hypothetical protein
MGDLDMIDCTIHGKIAKMEEYWNTKLDAEFLKGNDHARAAAKEKAHHARAAAEEKTRDANAIAAAEEKTRDANAIAAAIVVWMLVRVFAGNFGWMLDGFRGLVLFLPPVVLAFFQKGAYAMGEGLVGSLVAGSVKLYGMGTGLMGFVADSILAHPTLWAGTIVVPLLSLLGFLRLWFELILFVCGGTTIAAAAWAYLVEKEDEIIHDVHWWNNEDKTDGIPDVDNKDEIDGIPNVDNKDEIDGTPDDPNVPDGMGNMANDVMGEMN